MQLTCKFAHDLMTKNVSYPFEDYDKYLRILTEEKFWSLSKEQK